MRVCDCACVVHSVISGNSRRAGHRSGRDGERKTSRLHTQWNIHVSRSPVRNSRTLHAPGKSLIMGRREARAELRLYVPAKHKARRRHVPRSLLLAFVGSGLPDLMTQNAR